MCKKIIKYPTEAEAKASIIEVGRRMYQRGLVASNDGNMSCKVSENELWATPTGVSKGFMTEDMLVKMDMEGNVLEGKLKPSSEMKMHLRIYRENPEIVAVTHAHPPVSTSFAVAGKPLESPILQESIVQLGTVPVAKYAVPGTEGLAESVVPFCKSHNAVLLANHGVVTWGSDVFNAYFRLESVEYYATIMMYTNIIGERRELNDKQIAELMAVRKGLGITSGGVPKGGAGV